jgi:hypothetical protein
MRPNLRVLLSLLGSSGLVLATMTAGQGSANASASLAAGGGTQTCTGTITSPGTLAGTYGNVLITGACVVDAGPADITGNLTLAPGSALTGLFGLDDQVQRLRERHLLRQRDHLRAGHLLVRDAPQHGVREHDRR